MRARVNPNNLTYQSAHYLFVPDNGYSVTLSCDLDERLNVSFSVEAYANDQANLQEAKSAADGHFRYFGNQLKFSD